MESLNGTIIEAEVIEALRSCFEGAVDVQMTLTSPHCPAVQSLPAEIEGKIKAVPGVTGAKIDLVWDPPWDQSKMSEAARLQLGMM
jgi:metal-sulfur cluster biosynthetic enzyme